LLVLSGCKNTVDNDSPLPVMEGKGYFLLSIGGLGNSKTVLPNPQYSDIEVFNLSFTHSTISALNFDEDLTSSDMNGSGVLTDPIPLDEGTWTLVVKAYTDTGKTELAAQGDETFLIGSGGVTSAAVELEEFFDGQGTFDWTISYGAGVTATAEMTIEGISTAFPLTAYTLDGVGPNKSINDELVLNAGYYRVVFTITNNNSQKAVLQEVVHIYRYLKSRFSPTFNTNHFFADLTGSVSITGTPDYGLTLTANTSLLNVNTGLRYQWLRNGTTAIGTNSSTYTVAGLDASQSITVTVTCDGYNGSKTSPAITGTRSLATWTSVTNSTFINQEVYSIAWGNNVFIAVGYEGHIARSTDRGQTWTAVTTHPFGIDRLMGVAYGNSRFVVVGENGLIGYSTDDGLTWNNAAASPLGTQTLNRVVYYNGNFILGSDDTKIATSTNGDTWTSPVTVTGLSYGIWSIAYDGTRYIAGSYDGCISSSTNLTAWSTLTTYFETGGNEISGLACNGSNYVVGTSNATYAYSTNSGTTWTASAPAPTVINKGIAYGDTAFVAVGAGALSYSTNNGLSWTNVLPYPFGSTMTCIAYGDHRFILGNAAGQLAYCDW